jgi:hypothetical protein
VKGSIRRVNAFVDKTARIHVSHIRGTFFAQR